MKIKCNNGCGLVFETKDKRRKYCSHKCSAIARNTGLKKSEETKNKIRSSLKNRWSTIIRTKTCAQCKTVFVADKNKRKYCSEDCFNKSRKAKIRKEISYRTFKKILTRAFVGWKCPFCEWNISFDVHHINGKGDNDLCSLILICPNHHYMADQGMIDKNILKKLSIGASTDIDSLLKNYYYGTNDKINFKRYWTKKDSQKEAKERNQSRINMVE